jgi:radical SAM superfamily enzyme YgiQ (UPF0313 family)
MKQTLNMKNIDVLLVSPAPQPEANLIYKLSGIVHPLGLGYIASYLRMKGYTVELIDNAIERYDEDRFIEYLKKTRPRYVGVSFYTGCAIDGHRLSRIVKNFDNTIIVIAGGPHASALPSDILSNEHVDYVVRGEGEETMASLLSALDNKFGVEQVSGISYRKDKEVIDNSPRPLIDNINDIPFPAYDLFRVDKYFLAPSRRFTRGMVGSIITSRGCPQRCAFCSRAIFGRSIRYRSPENVVDEIEELIKKYGFTEFEFRDDTFTLDEERAVKICELIIKRNIKIAWNCCGRVNQVSDRLFKALSQAGCRALFIGAEFGTQRMLDLMKKDITLEQIQTAVNQCKKYKILSLTSFIIGAPGETVKTVKETIAFAKKLDPDFVSFCAYTPLPGSELFDDLVSKGIINIDNVNWEECIRLLLYPPPFQVGDFTPRELVKWQKKALREFYLRPKYILKRILCLRTLQSIFSVIAGTYIVVSHQLKRIISYKKNRIDILPADHRQKKQEPVYSAQDNGSSGI